MERRMEVLAEMDVQYPHPQHERLGFAVNVSPSAEREICV
jgi:hypothetical protein